MDGETAKGIINLLFTGWLLIFVVYVCAWMALGFFLFPDRRDACIAFTYMMKRIIGLLLVSSTTLVITVAIALIVKDFEYLYVIERVIAVIGILAVALTSVLTGIPGWRLPLWKRKELRKPEMELAQETILASISGQAVMVYVRDEGIQDKELEKVREHYEDKGYFKGVETNDINSLAKVLVPAFRLHEMSAEIEEFTKVGKKIGTYFSWEVYICYKRIRYIINRIEKASEDRFKLIKETGAKKIADLKKLNKDTPEKLNKTDRDKLNQLAELDEILCSSHSSQFEENIPLTKKEIEKQKKIWKIWLILFANTIKNPKTSWGRFVSWRNNNQESHISKDLLAKEVKKIVRKINKYVNIRIDTL